MPITLPPELSRLIEEKLASGGYRGRDEVLHAALKALCEQEKTCDAIAEGYEDFHAGHHRTWQEADAEFRKQSCVPSSQ